MKRLHAVWFASLVSMTLIATGFSVGAGDDDRDNRFRARLTGFQEVPVVSTLAQGRFVAWLSADGTTLNYQLTFSNLQGAVTQAHIHLGQKSVNGAIVLWLCGTATNPGPAGTPACPAPGGTVTGTLTSANVIVVTSQGIAAGDLGEILRAMQAGVTYANVHSSPSPAGEIRGQVSDD